MKILKQKAKEVKDLYDEFNLKTTGKKWGFRECTEGLVGDVGDLMKLIMSKAEVRQYDKGNLDNEIKHELSDCLWSILVIADDLGIDLETEFVKQMEGLKVKVKKKLQT